MQIFNSHFQCVESEHIRILEHTVYAPVVTRSFCILFIRILPVDNSASS